MMVAPIMQSATQDDRMVSVNELAMYQPPRRTRSYTPVSHSEVCEVVSSTANRLGLDLLGEAQVIVTRKGQQMFGVINARWNDERNLTIGFRNSYDKTTSMGIATGQSVMVCSNMCFSGRDATFMRKHTGVNPLLDFAGMVQTAIGKSREEAKMLDADFTKLHDKPCALDDGYGVLGRMLGHQVLTPTQANEAVRHWREPVIEEHATRNGMGLYNAITQGLKQGAMSMGRYARAHTFLMAQAA
jgi:hypothetical protein